MIQACFTTMAALDTTSWWRGLRALHELQHQFPDRFSVQCPPQIDWATFSRYNLLYVQRPHAPEFVEALQIAQRDGVPSVVEIDDLMWDLPAGNTARLGATKKRIEDLHYCLIIADLVIVSTDHLATRIRKFRSGPIVVVRNALGNKQTWKPIDPRPGLVAWRGGVSHYFDIDSIRAPLCWAMEANDSLSFVAMGSDFPPLCTEQMKGRYEAVAPIDIEAYFANLVALRPQVIISPLIDNEFNKAKSDIAALEAAYAGAVLVAPKLGEFDALVPGRVLYDGAGGFRAALDDALDMSKHKERVELARAWIDSSRRMRHVNELRLTAMEGLMK